MTDTSDHTRLCERLQTMKALVAEACERERNGNGSNLSAHWVLNGLEEIDKAIETQAQQIATIRRETLEEAATAADAAKVRSHIGRLAPGLALSVNRLCDEIAAAIRALSNA